MKQVEELMKLCYAQDLKPVGSRVTCNPPPENSDQDFLVLVAPDDYQKALDAVRDEAFELGGSELGTGVKEFFSFKKGDINLILTNSKKEFDSFMLATNVAKELNLLNKAHRKMLFEAVMYGVFMPPVSTEIQF